MDSRKLNAAKLQQLQELVVSNLERLKTIIENVENVENVACDFFFLFFFCNILGFF